MPERLPEMEFLKLCIQRDMKMLSECDDEAEDLERRAIRWSRLEAKLRRRSDKARHRIAIGKKIRRVPLNEIGGNTTDFVFLTAQWDKIEGGPELVHRWKKRALNRRREARICCTHFKKKTDKARKLRNLMLRLEVNVTKCGTRLRNLLGVEIGGGDLTGVRIGSDDVMGTRT